MPEPLVLRVKRLTPTARLPEKAFPDDVGFDLYVDTVTFPGGLRSESGVALVDTGVSVAPPPGWFCRVEGRSSLGARGIDVLGGVVDPGYSGPVVVVLSGPEVYAVKPGDRVAQLVLAPCPAARVVEVDELPPSGRGGRGFGSSERKPPDVPREPPADTPALPGVFLCPSCGWVFGGIGRISKCPKCGLECGLEWGAEP